MQKRTFLIVMLLASSSTASMAGHRHAHRLSYSAYPFVQQQQLSYNAYLLARQQQFWPNRPLCDDGGYRIRPCDLGTGGRR